MSKQRRTGTTLGDIWRILLRHKKKVFVCFVLLMLAPVLTILYGKRSYKSEAKLLVRVGRESVSLDPTATMGETISVVTSREFEINSILETLRSRFMVEKLVDAIGTDVLLGNSHETDWKSYAPKWLPEQWVARLPDLNRLRIPSLDPISDREAVIKQLGARINVWAARQSNIIDVGCEAGTPELAQKIAATLVEVYLTEHARLNRTPGSLPFFQEQVALSKEKLNHALESLRDTKNKMGLVSVESNRQVLQGAITAVENDRAQTQASLVASRAKAEVLRGAVATLPERITTDEVVGHPNMASDQMRQHLYDLEIRKAEVASRYTDVYPDSRVLQKLVEEAWGIFAKQEAQRTQRTTTLNTTRQQLHLALLSEESNVSSLAGRMQGIEKQIADLDKRVRRLNDQETEIAQLQSQVDLCSAGYMIYAKKLEQSSADQSLQSERITNVNLLQPATYVGEPVSPNKRALLAAGLLLAIAASAGLALITEYSSSPIETRAEPSPRDIRRRRRAADLVGANVPR